MHRTHLIRVLTVLLVAAIACLALAGPALAAGETATPGPAAAAMPEPAAATTPAPAQATAGASRGVVVDQSHFLVLLTITLVFALLALGAVFLYTYFIQRKFYDIAANLGQSGKSVQATSVRPWEGAARQEAYVEGETPPVPAPMQISGPASVTVGTESGEFVASWVEGNAPAADAAWSVDPPNAAVVNPTSGAKVKVIAAVAGAFALTASVAGQKPGTAQLRVAAVAAQASAVQLPFIGHGYGSIVIAVILIAAVIVLGVGGVLSGEGVATLLGALLGYIFGVTKAATSTPESGEKAGG